MEKVALAERWPAIASCRDALTWLGIQVDLGLSPRTIDAYARAMTDYLTVCRRDAIDPLIAGRSEIAHYVRDLRQRPSRRGTRVITLDSGAGLANATLQQRLVAVRLFYDHLIEEAKRETNPVGRGRFTPGRFANHGERGLVPRLTRLPWIPTDDQWRSLLSVAAADDNGPVAVRAFNPERAVHCPGHRAEAPRFAIVLSARQLEVITKPSQVGASIG